MTYAPPPRAEIVNTVEQFTKSLAATDPTVRLLIWRSAKKMVREIEPFLPSARLISLDHDLEPQEGELEDPGDEIEVARFLTEGRLYVRLSSTPATARERNG
jgi:hypothetical protein